MIKYKDFEYEKFSDGRIRSAFPKIGEMIFKNESEFVSYVDGYHYTQESFKMIETELRNAVERHPEFCSAIFDPASSKSWIETERQIKLRNECGPEYADCILMEEMAEAFAAYEQGDKAHCIQELAQCGAVIIRMMEFVKKEMEGKAV